MVSRRGLINGAAVASSGALLLGWAAYSSDPVLALSGQVEWVATGAEITSHDGRVDSITFGDPDEEGDPGSDDNRIVLDWSGLGDGSHSVEFDVLLRGPDNDSGLIICRFQPEAQRPPVARSINWIGCGGIVPR